MRHNADLLKSAVKNFVFPCSSFFASFDEFVELSGAGGSNVVFGIMSNPNCDAKKLKLVVSIGFAGSGILK